LKAANVEIAYRPAEIPQLIQSLGVL
jgi:hypothetical protein